MSTNTTITHYKDLPRGQYAILVLPNFTAVMTGVWKIGQTKDGTITLAYTDKTTESAKLPAINILKEDASIFSIISAVQAKRTKAEGASK